MSPASGADNAGKPMLMSQVRKVGANSCGRRSVFSAIRGVEVPEFFSLHNSCNHVTEVGGP